MSKTNFSMPAEWSPHQAILLAWPHNPRTWPGRVEDVRRVYLDFIREISESEMVWLLVANAESETEVRRRLRLHGVQDTQLRCVQHFTNDAWIRDYGPIAVYDQSKKLTFTDWQFNGWGDKYAHEESYISDNLVPSVLGNQFDIPVVSENLILEGGSIDVNGKGTILTSQSCLLNENRNSHLSQNQIRERIAEKLGVHHWIWVPEGIAGDDTDGHIDDTVRFVNDTTVVCAFEKNPHDINHKPLKECFAELNRAFDQDGRPLTVVKLPMPTPYCVDGERLPASYANFLITNEKVLVPTFACKEDQNALGILQDLFPKRKVVGIDARDLVLGFGSLHCLSQQIPRNVLNC